MLFDNVQNTSYRLLRNSMLDRRIWCYSCQPFWWSAKGRRG